MAVLSASSGAADEPTWGHAGSLGLSVAAGGAYVTAVTTRSTGESRARVPLELGATLGITERTDLRLAGRLAPPGPSPEWGILAGFRSHRGDRLKTFVDLDVTVTGGALWAAGLRGGVGLQYELLPVMGAFAVAGFQAGYGSALRLAFEVQLGLQWRTYVFQ